MTPAAKRKGLLLAGISVLVLAGVLFRNEIDREALIAFGRDIPAGWFLSAFFLLPLIGFPVSPLLILVGARFGFWGGAAVAAAGIVFHNFAAFRITHGLLRDRVRRWLAASGHKLPEFGSEDQAGLTAMFVVIQGPPYFLKLYLLALTDVKFRIYVWVGAPIYLLFGLVPVAAGAALMELDSKFIFLSVAGSVAFVAVGIAFRTRRLRREAPG